MIDDLIWPLTMTADEKKLNRYRTLPPLANNG